MSTLAILENLLRDMSRMENRRKGHTTNALEFARKIGARYIAGTYDQASSIPFEFKDLDILSLYDYRRPSLTRKPIVMDNHAIEILIADAAREIRHLQSELLEAKEKLAAIKELLK